MTAPPRLAPILSEEATRPVAPWWRLIVTGLALGFVGAMIAGVGSAAGDPNAGVILLGAIIGGVGSACVFVALVAAGVYLGMKHLATESEAVSK